MQDSNEMTYYEMFNVIPQTFEEVRITALSLTPRFIFRLKENGIKTICDLLKLRRSYIQLLPGIGEKQLENIENELKKFISKYLDGTIGVSSKKSFHMQKNHSVLANSSSILVGDFSFKDNISDGDRCRIEEYETAFNTLGTDLVQKICNNTDEFRKLSAYLDMLAYDYFRFNEKRKNALTVMEGIPAERLSKPAYGFIIASLPEKEAEALLALGDMKKFTLQNLVYVPDMEKAKEIESIYKVYNKSRFDLDYETESIINELSSKDILKDIIEMRSRNMTLAEIGEAFGVTRERIRQIELKARHKFDIWNDKYKVLAQISAILDSETVLTSSEILNALGENNPELLLHLFKISDQDYYKYIPEADIFIIGDASILHSAYKFVELMPDIIHEKDCLLYCSKACDLYGISEKILLNVIKLKYKKSGCIFHRMSLNHSIVYKYIIENYYPEGIRVYDEEELANFRKIIFNEFGDISVSSSDRGIAARIADICVLCDKGKYRLKKEEYLPSELLSDINIYIENENRSVILVNSIFSVFEKRLKECGIDNRYYLQGVLRDVFGDLYSYNRDYLFKDKTITSFYDEIVRYIKSSDYPVKKEQIQNAFPGITEIVISFAVSDENVINFFGEYMHSSKLKLDENDRKYLISITERIISDNQAHHSKEIYEYILRDNPNVMRKLGVYHAYSLFSILEYLMRYEVQFSRPYIALNGVNIGRPMEVIKEWVRLQDVVAVSNITGYAREIRYQFYSILDMVTACSESHLFMNFESIASIEYIGVNEDIAVTIENLIADELEGTTLIAELNCISHFPKINIAWTDWLIYSVLLKWGTKTEVSVTNNQFQYASPVVSIKGKLDLSEVELNNVKIGSDNVYQVDDLDNIDDFIADFFDDDLF